VPGGRPSKLTAETTERFCHAVRAGNTREAAAHYAGITSGLARQWCIKGRQATSGKFFTFLTAVKRAESDAEIRNVALIQKAAQEGNWTAAAWWLERRRPKRWGRKDWHRHEHSGGPLLLVSEVVVVHAEEEANAGANGEATACQTAARRPG
jgi:hypothetical protein